MTIAGIVTYNPKITTLNENILRLLMQCKEIIIIDNKSINIGKIKDLCQEYDNIYLLENNENGGIAKGLNQLIDIAYELGYKWILTMDQDSLILPGIIEKYEYYSSKPGIGMITCNITERNDFEKLANPKEVQVEEFHKCITSGCYTNISIVKCLGGFDESFFIDYVDFDMCYRMVKAGYKLIKINYNGLIHSTGNLKVMKVFGQKIRLGGNKIYIYHESPTRIYYFFRNAVFFWRKYGLNGKEFTNPIHIAWRALLIVIYEKPKIEKIKMIFAGIRDGIKKEII